MRFKTIINIKKLISILLCTVSISSVIPTTVLGGTGSNGLVEAPKLSQSITVKNFEELKHQIENAQQGKTILLGKDIKIPSNESLNINTNITIASDGAPKTITLDKPNGQSRNNHIFNIFGCTVNLKNITIDFCNENNSNQCHSPINITNGSTLNINSGTTIENLNSNINLIQSDNSTINLNKNSCICNCNCNSNEGTICLKNHSELNINGGCIRNCSAINGGAVFLSSSKITQTAGTIVNCTASQNGGAIYSAGSSKISAKNLKISGCYSTSCNGEGKGNAIYMEQSALLNFFNKNSCKINIPPQSKGVDNGQTKYGYSGIYDNGIITKSCNDITPIKNDNNCDSDNGASYNDNSSDIELICNYDGTLAENKLPFTLKGNTVAKIVNTTNNNYILKENKDYTIKNDEIFLTYEYLNNLNKSTYELKVYFYPGGKKNIKPDSLLIKTVHLNVKKQDQQAKFNNLKSEYTYGEDPGIISLNGVSGNNDVLYHSTDTNVAEIDKTSGKLTIKKVGTFHIVATKKGDDVYNDLYVKSKEIEVKKRKLDIINTKIKDKPFSGTCKAKFEKEKPTLEGIVNNDDVILVPGVPFFKETCIKEKIEIGFLEPFYLEGTDRENYYIDQPKDIYAKIYEAVPPKITELILTDEDGASYTPNKDEEYDYYELPDDGEFNTDYNCFGWSNQNITLLYTFERGSFKIKPEDTEISINNGNLNTGNFKNIKEFLNILQIDEQTKSNLKFTILKEGTYQIKIKIYDTKSNCYESSPALVKIKKSIPNPVKITSSNYSNNKKPTIFGLGEANCTVAVNYDNGAKTIYDSVSPLKNYKWEITTQHELSEGKHTIKAYQIDDAGNTSTPVYQELIVDLHGPTGSIKINNKVSNPTTGIIASKLPIHVEILAEDKLSGINKIEYLQTNKKDISNDNNWKPYYGPFNLELPPNKPNDFFYLLAKLTDNASNQTLLYSGGIVQFTNSGSK